MRTKKLLRMQMFHQCISRLSCNRMAMRDAVRFQSLFILKRYLKGDKNDQTEYVTMVYSKPEWKININRRCETLDAKKWSRKILQQILCCIHAKCPFLMITQCTVHTFYARFVAALFHFTSCTVHFGSLRCTPKPKPS